MSRNSLFFSTPTVAPVQNEPTISVKPEIKPSIALEQIPLPVTEQKPLDVPPSKVEQQKVESKANESKPSDVVEQIKDLSEKLEQLVLAAIPDSPKSTPISKQPEQKVINTPTEQKLDSPKIEQKVSVPTKPEQPAISEPVKPEQTPAVSEQHIPQPVLEQKRASTPPKPSDGGKKQSPPSQKKNDGKKPDQAAQKKPDSPKGSQKTAPPQKKGAASNNNTSKAPISTKQDKLLMEDALKDIPPLDTAPPDSDRDSVSTSSTAPITPIPEKQIEPTPPVVNAPPTSNDPPTGPKNEVSDEQFSSYFSSL